MPLLFAVGPLVEREADGAKYVFKSTRSNDGKLCTGGVWLLVRHPSLLGLCPLLRWLVRECDADADLVYVYVMTSFPTSQRYLATKYKQQWTQYCQQTRSKILPLVY